MNTMQSDPNVPVSDDVINCALSAINGISPKDEVEAMLATHMVVANHFAMDLARRTKQADYVSPLNIGGNLTIKFLRIFNAQLDALQRYRGKGQQKIVVERVNVSKGGKAIVGAVEQLRRQDEAGNAMSGAGS